MSKPRTRSRAAKQHYKEISAQLKEAEGQFDLGNWVQCGEMLKSILRREPEHLSALELLARSQWRQSEFSSALSTLERLISLNPYEPGYFYLRGLIYQSVGQVRPAVESFSRCLGESNAQLAEQAASAIGELMKWQEEAVKELLAVDQEFALKYLQNPQRACQERGLCFEAPSNLTHWLKGSGLRDLVWDRPS